MFEDQDAEICGPASSRLVAPKKPTKIIPATTRRLHAVLEQRNSTNTRALENHIVQLTSMANTAKVSPLFWQLIKGFKNRSEEENGSYKCLLPTGFQNPLPEFPGGASNSSSKSSFPVMQGLSSLVLRPSSTSTDPIMPNSAAFIERVYKSVYDQAGIERKQLKEKAKKVIEATERKLAAEERVQATPMSPRDSTKRRRTSSEMTGSPADGGQQQTNNNPGGNSGRRGGAGGDANLPSSSSSPSQMDPKISKEQAEVQGNYHHPLHPWTIDHLHNNNYYYRQLYGCFCRPNARRNKCIQCEKCEPFSIARICSVYSEVSSRR